MAKSSDTPIADPSVSADLLVSFLKSFPGRAWIKDSAGRYIYASDSLLAAFELTREEVVGATDDSRFPGYARGRTRSDHLALSSGQPQRSTEVIREHGQTRFLFIVRFPIDSVEGRFVGGLAIEMTEEISALEGLHRVNQQLFRSERLRSVGELASGIAHDINNSLNAMLLGIELLRNEEVDSTLSRRIERLGRVMKDAAVRVTRLQDVVHERFDEPLESVDLRSVIEEAVEMVHFVVEKSPTPTGGMIKVSFEVPSLAPILGYSAELRHVFANLLLNARDALPSGGNIVITGELLEDAIVIGVADDGVGIKQDLLAKIFDPLFTTKNTGTGLGLSMARDVMTRMGGSISADNRPQGGAIFNLRFPLPRVVSRPESPPQQGSQPAASASSRSILIVDDYEDSLNSLKAVLELRGQNVETATSGKEALARIQSGATFDVMLCDLNLKEMDGWAIAEAVSRIANGPRFYLMTGWLPDLPDNDPKRALVKGILNKPIDLERLFRILDGID